MQRRASSRYGATMARVGQTSMQAVQLPQCALTGGGRAAAPGRRRSRRGRTSSRRRGAAPACACRASRGRARVASSTSSTGAESVNTRWPKGPTGLRQPVGQPLQALAQHLVVVAAAGIDRDHGLPGSPQRGARSRCSPVGRGVARQVVHARGDHAHACPAPARPAARASVPWRPCRPSGRGTRPSSQASRPGSAATQVDVGDADLGESQLMRPLPQLLHQRLPHVESQTLVACPDSRNPHPASGPTRPPAPPSPPRWPRSPRCATPSSNCRARSAPARPPSCATCCVRWAWPAASRARPTPCWSRYEAGDLAISHFDFYRFNDPREWARCRLSRRLRRARAEARRMARERRRPCCPCPTCACTSRPARRRAAASRLDALTAARRGAAAHDGMHALRRATPARLRCWRRCCWRAALRVRRRRSSRCACGRRATTRA